MLRHSTAHVLAQAVQDIFPEAKLGIGPPIENGFYYDFDVAKPFVPDDLAKLEKRMQEIVKSGQRFRRRALRRRWTRPRRELADEPYKLELVDLKGEVDAAEVMEVGGGELTIYDNLDTDGERGLGRPVPRAAPADHPADPRVQADAQRRRVLAGQREEPAAAADLRHRVADPRRAEGVPAAARGGGPPRPPQARRRPGPVLLPRRDRLRPGGVPPQGRHHPPGDGELLAGPARAGRLRVRQHPAHHQGAAVRDLRAPRLVRGRHVPAHGDGGRELLPQADELPVPRPDLPVPRAVLPRAAAAACSSSARSTGTRSPAWCTA